MADQTSKKLKLFFFQKISKVRIFSGHSQASQTHRLTNQQTNRRTECLIKLLVAAKNVFQNFSKVRIFSGHSQVLQTLGQTNRLTNRWTECLIKLLVAAKN